VIYVNHVQPIRLPGTDLSRYDV